MLLHIGENIALPLDRLLFIVNERGMTPRTRAFIEQARIEHRYMRTNGKAKCYIVMQERGREVVYESMLASGTLEKRLRGEIARKYLTEQSVIMVQDA